MSEIRLSTNQDRVYRSSRVRMVHRGVWIAGEASREADAAAEQAARAALLAVPTGILVDDWAAWALARGRIGPPKLPVRVGVDADSAIESRRGLTVRHSTFPACDVTLAGGLPAAAPARTAVDVLCDWRRLGRLRVIELVDALLNRRLTTHGELAARLADSHQRGVVRARMLLDETEPGAESGQETRLRLAIVDDGLPRPQAQWTVSDELGQFLARCDLGYPDLRLGIEYLGEVHKEQLAQDWARQFELNARDVFVMGVTAAHLRTPAVVANRVREARRRQARVLGHRS